MYRKVLILLLSVLLSVGCSQSQDVLKVERSLAEGKTIAAELACAEKILEDFFKKYFKVSLENIVILNKKINRDRAFDAPRMVTVPNGVVLETLGVESVVIEGIEQLGDCGVYYVSVVTKNKMMTQEDFEGCYQWDEACDYYVETPSKIEVMPILDTIRIERKYWVEINQEKKIKSVKEANPIQVDETYRKRVLWNQHVRLLPYRKTINKDEELLVKEKLEALLADLKVSEATPYKDNIVKVEWDLKKLRVEGVQNSSKLSPRFKINVAAKVLLNNNEVIYYNYNYLIEIGQNKINEIQFIGIDKN